MTMRHTPISSSAPARLAAQRDRRKLMRRRWDALRLSVQNPHPETTGLVDTRLSGWMSDLSQRL
jgi:hypothetical protein